MPRDIEEVEVKISENIKLLEDLLKIVIGDEHNQEGILGILEHDEHGLGANCDKNACSKCRMITLWEKYPVLNKFVEKHS